MKIAIDIDQVLCDSNKYFLDYFNKKHNTNFTLEHFNDYFFEWTKEYGFEPNYVFEELVKYIEGNLEEYELIENAKETIYQLKNRYKLYILTSRSKTLQDKTIKWLNYHFGENFFEDIIFVNENHHIHKCKSEVCKHHNFNLLIEDMPMYAINTSNLGIKVFLFSWPWNKNLEQNDNLIRVNSWQEIQKNIEKLK